MSLYQDRLLTEGIRIIEKSTPSDQFHADYAELSFEQALTKRTKLAELRYQIAPVLKHFQQLFTVFCGLLSILFFILGASSVSQLLVNQSNSQINFFWAIVLFLAPNLLSLIIWLFVFFKPGALSSSWLANVSLSLISLLDKLLHKAHDQHPYYTSLFRYYFEHQFGAYFGRARLSLVSHLWWTCYLLGATLSLLLVLATHQVDFIWQTTILSESVFTQITQLLTTPPHFLGITVPNANDVAQASIGAINSLSSAQQSRVSWANLLIFSLTVYALLPRVMLMLFFKHRVKSKKRQFQVNFSLPYYVQLKGQLQPVSNRSFISDPDSEGRDSVDLADRHDLVRNSRFPTDALPLAIELNSALLSKVRGQIDPIYSVSLINVIDGQTQQQAISLISDSNVNDLALYVDIKRVPDRGWLSFVKKCNTDPSMMIYLVILGEVILLEDERASLRFKDWIEMAAQAGIDASRITYKQINEVESE
ncbi:DUF2868 domain-containing protein [Psychromonas sp. 14N.309.X.WAT.B.A12]|uniref:DUF2868 domain-containing protein n=1 Tax=unclassified Psychromonas TaxID=2614957 RepID=UPI0025AF73F9|nr:DUF2868 domain-containing protein [Psychromonas sp. 14N.309.X.WAT.B.A12]MDN2663987.1 DUF2868 domain-containing protein [Psychromonas sp. 14N.309.X.WAT.B.A12]